MADPAYATELEKQYPRIVEKLVMLWEHDGLLAYLSHLLIDDRGDRQGFSGEIMADIMFLNNLKEDMLRDAITKSGTIPESGSRLWENPLIKNLQE